MVFKIEDLKKGHNCYELYKNILSKGPLIPKCRFIPQLTVYGDCMLLVPPKEGLHLSAV